MAANLPMIDMLLQAGMDPKTGLPIKVTGCTPSALKDTIKKTLRINDEQLAINRYTWYNLPDDLDGQLIERILYYRGQGAFFFMPSLDKFFFLPYALDGDIDVYGRYTGITPVPFNGSLGKDEKEIKPWIKGMIKTPMYSVNLAPSIESFEDGCVLLSDYSKQLSQTVIPRQILNDGIIDVESDCIPFMRTNLLNSTGIQGMRVNSQDEYASVGIASKQINEAALKGEKYVPIVGGLEFQTLTDGQLARSEDFMLAMQSIDNFRLGTFGLENGGLFEKKAHELQIEAAMNKGSIGGVMQDGLTLRQNFCDIVNSNWGLGIWCDVSETVGVDRNFDGILEDNSEDDMIETQHHEDMQNGGMDNVSE